MNLTQIKKSIKQPHTALCGHFNLHVEDKFLQCKDCKMFFSTYREKGQKLLEEHRRKRLKVSKHHWNLLKSWQSDRESLISKSGGVTDPAILADYANKQPNH
jgi:hypothetical protein